MDRPAITTGVRPAEGTMGDDDAGDDADAAPIDPSGVGQFLKRDRCHRYIKQRVDPGAEPTARDWTEAFSASNVGLLGHGQEFEATQLEALAANATRIIGPEITGTAAAGVPDIAIDETWAASTAGRVEQLQAAAATAATLSAADGEYVLCYQAPLGGEVGAEAVWGEADCLVFAPTPPSTEAVADEPDTAAHPAREQSTEAVIARVLEIKSATEQHSAHNVQAAIYSQLLEQTLEEQDSPACRIETSVLLRTQAASPGAALDPLMIPTFPRAQWEVFATELLAEGGPIDAALNTALSELPFALTNVCSNCAYREACATRAVEDPTAPASLALVGLDAGTQRTLREHGITDLQTLSDLLPRVADPTPTAPAPTPTGELAPQRRRALEEALPEPIHQTVQRAQARRGEVDPSYPSATRPPAYRGHGWVPLPDDRVDGWGNTDAAAGELIHVAITVRPDTTIDRVAALGACVYAEADDTYHEFSETIAAIPDTDTALATTLEGELLERFCEQLFATIETVATALGTPTAAHPHLYTYTRPELDALAEGLERHPDVSGAAALRNLLSLHRDGHTDVDQAVASAVQPVLSEHFALTHPSEGVLPVAEQFVPGWTMEAFDPLDARPDTPPLRVIVGYQFLRDRVPYLADGDRIRLHLAPGPFAEGPTAAALTPDEKRPTPDGWYPIRPRQGSQFPIEYLWAALPAHPNADTPRLTPARAAEWTDDPDTEALYRQEIQQFYYRTDENAEVIQRADIEYLLERLSYTLCRLVESIPYKDTYIDKPPLDATALSTFELPVTTVPAAGRDYLRMEHGAKRDAIETQYRQPLRSRLRSGRSLPVTCTDVEHADDGTLTITGKLAYEAVFEPDAAATVASQTRARDSQGATSGSWGVLTGLRPTGEGDDEADGGADAYTEIGVEAPREIKHSPPVIVDGLDHASGTVRLTAFPHRFRRRATPFRVDHCGWTSPVGSNVADPAASPADRAGYIAERPPVEITPGSVFVVDPMIDDLVAPKVDRALAPPTITQNALYQHLQTISTTGHLPGAPSVPSDGVEQFLATMDAAPACLTPNERQRAFITATDRSIVPLQGPPGTGKTSGATAPALLARAFAAAQRGEAFTGLVVAPSHEAVDAVLEGVVAGLQRWRHSEAGLSTLEVCRVVPSPPPTGSARVDAATPSVEVTYCNYHSDDSDDTLARLARTAVAPEPGSTPPTQQLVFTTPATLYRVLGAIADARSEIDGTSAPAAMRHDAGLADVLCVDEASMLSVPGLLLAGSAVRPDGQTLVVGDHRQLATVTQVEWADTLRRPLRDTGAYQSALQYLRELAAEGSGSNGTTPSTDPDREADHGRSAEPSRPDGADTTEETDDC
jgi:hypothetical protein